MIVGVDEQDSRLNTSEFLAYLLQSKAPGSQLALSVLRRGKRMHVVIPVIK